jgi:hypothetical protein
MFPDWDQSFYFLFTPSLKILRVKKELFPLTDDLLITID